MTKARILALFTLAVLGTACASDNDAHYLSAEQCSSATPWTEWTPFATGDVVSYEGAVYQCVQGHTSQPDWTPDVVPALWAIGICDGGGDPGGDDNGGGGDDDSGGGGDDSGGGGGGAPPAGFVFSPYKDTSIHMNWNTSVASTQVSGSATALPTDLKTHGVDTITLAFATGECGAENWGGIQGRTMADANRPLLDAAGVDFILSTGGAAGSFTCGTDSGFEAFLAHWASPHLVGIDLDIEAGQSAAQITDLIRRVRAAHIAHPELRFSLTIATLANNDGSPTAHSLGDSIGSSLSAHGNQTMDAVSAVLGFDGSEASWPSFVTVNLMTMDYGTAGSGVCVVSGGICDMGESAIQAAYNLHDHFGVPFANIELTPMIGGNDVQSEHFTLDDVDTMMGFVLAKGLAGAHYWSYDRDVDCPIGSASPICNSLGGVGAYGFLEQFQASF